jgi:NADH:ubiquinone oxidoreductase subunit F (NADH-binding)
VLRLRRGNLTDQVDRRPARRTDQQTAVPGEKGLWQKPTIVNNVETLANVPVIFLKGAEWFSFSWHDQEQRHQGLRPRGKVNNVGLVEVPMA